MAYQKALTALAALGDPTRRDVLDRLRGGPLSVGELAARLPVSRPAVSQHLKALQDAGLVRHEAIGTRRVYEVDPRGLAQVRSWLDHFWGEALAAFQVEAERQPVGPRRSTSPRKAKRKPR